MFISKLSKKQYTWAMLRAFAAAEKWSNIDDLFMSKVCKFVTFILTVSILV